MGESVTEGSISAVLKQVGDSVKVDDDIAQVEAGKAAIAIKSPASGVLERLLVKPNDTVVPGQLVAVIGAAAPVAAAAGGAPASAGAAAARAAAPVAASASGHSPMISFPPRVTTAGVRISDLPAAEYEAAVAAAAAAAQPAAAPSAPQAPAVPAPPQAAPAAAHPMPAAKAAPPPTTKNKLTYVTRPDGRGGPPRRELTVKELEIINLGGAV